MALKGKIGTSMGGAMEYRYQLKPTTQDCRNCVSHQKSAEKKFGYCLKFRMMITDSSNAKLCSGFSNKHAKKSKPKKGKIGAKTKRGQTGCP